MSEPKRRRRLCAAARSVVAAEAYEYERRLKLPNIAGFVALNGYAHLGERLRG